MDPGIAPGDDFFAYANGAWLKQTSIPTGRERWTARNEIDAVTRRHMAELFDGIGSAPSGSLARKVADFRAAFLNEADIEARGLAPVATQLDRIGAANDKVSLTRLFGEGMQSDVDPLNWGLYRSSSLLGLSVEPGINGEKTYVAFLLQGGLGLPDRENYVSADASMQALRASYQDYIAKLLALAGFDHANTRAASVMALETALAQTQATAEVSAVDRNADNLWTRADFASKAPGIDWSEFFSAAGLGQQPTFVAWQPSAVTGMAALVASQPLAVWQDYMRFHVLDRYAELLPRAFAGPALAMHSLEQGAPSAPPLPRDQRATAAVQASMGDAVGQLYVERYFAAAEKARLHSIATNVVTALRRRVETVPWMTPATRAIAVTKLQGLYVGLGYPETWENYADLVVDPDDAVGNLGRASIHNYRQAVTLLGRDVDKAQWWMTPQTVGAILVFQQNALEFPAALLQEPKYDPQESDAAAYGAIGAIIGHESSHFVDPLGADYEADGRKRRWWTAEDDKQFEAASAPLVKQFSGYHPFPDIAIDGKLTSSENIADLAGLSAAFEAYRLTIGGKLSDKDFVRRADRAFFIAFARSWRAKSTESALRKQAATSDHAPETYRISTVRNLDAWYEAFDVQPGQRLYLEPSARVKVW